MALSPLSLLLLGASLISASPLQLQPRSSAPSPSEASATSHDPILPSPTPFLWNEGAVTDFQIHRSCNISQRTYLQNGLQETLALTRQARDHILRWGNDSAIYRKYFGDAPTGEPLGWFSRITEGDKKDILFRCDNIDGNCELEGWAGHHRGANATSETVICDLSYELRRPLAGMCMHGFDIATGATNLYWGSDLLHRLLHIPKLSEGVIDHYEGADDYESVLELAKKEPEKAVRNSDSLQYFALEVYAYDVAVPGVGCVGEEKHEEKHGHDDQVTSAASASPTALSTVTGWGASVTEAPTTTADAEEKCEAHGDHWHCPEGVPEPTSPPS